MDGHTFPVAAVSPAGPCAHHGGRMNRRFIALVIVSAVFGLSFLAGCQNHDRDEKTTKMKVDTDGSHKEMTIKHD
jgi:hypothetical protein